MMDIFVNNNMTQIEDETTVSELLEKLSISSEGVAVALGSSIIKRDEWCRTKIESGQKVTIIRATQGG